MISGGVTTSNKDPAGVVSRPSKDFHKTRSAGSISATPAANAVVIVEGYDDDIATWAVGDKIRVLAPALEEAQPNLDPLARATGSHFNYVQEIERVASITWRAEDQRYRGTPEKARISAQALLDFRRNIDSALMYSKRALVTGANASLPVPVMGGLKWYATNFGNGVNPVR